MGTKTFGKVRSIDMKNVEHQVIRRINEDGQFVTLEEMEIANSAVNM